LEKEFQSDRSGFVLKVDLDIDPPEGWLAAWERKNLLILGQFDIVVKKVNKAKTTKGWHYWYLSKKWLNPEETNKLQFLLGDDHTRVKINAWRIKRGVPHWNKLYDRKLWRKNQEFVECWYCGNRIPIITKGEKIEQKEE